MRNRLTRAMDRYPSATIALLALFLAVVVPMALAAVLAH
jgi:hypothetical protein